MDKVYSCWDCGSVFKVEVHVIREPYLCPCCGSQRLLRIDLEDPNSKELLGAEGPW